MPRSVLLTAGAERDLASIYDDVAEAESERAAEKLLNRLLDVADGLRRFPDRGKPPRELLELGIREFRQLTMRLEVTGEIGSPHAAEIEIGSRMTAWPGDASAAS